MRKVPEEEKQRIRREAKEKLSESTRVCSDKETMERVDRFKTGFEICEIVYKQLLREHQRAKTGKMPDRMVISMTQVPYVFQFAGYTDEHDLLNNLFGSKDLRMHRSAKKLRDRLTHSIDEHAIQELTLREVEFNGYFDAFYQFIEKSG